MNLNHPTPDLVPALRQLWNLHQTRRKDAGYLLWGILNLALFVNAEP